MFTEKERQYLLDLIGAVRYCRRDWDQQLWDSWDTLADTVLDKWDGWDEVKEA